MRRAESPDIHGRVGEVTWYAADGRELARVQRRYSGILGDGDAVVIVPSVAARTAAELADLREAVTAACDEAALHLAELAKEPSA